MVEWNGHRHVEATSAVTVNLSIGAAQNTGGAGTDTLLNIENLTGSNFNDTLSGDGNNNTLDGGAGTDTVTYASAGAGVTVSLAISGAQNTGGAGTDTLLNFENLTGSAFNDTLSGDGNNNTLDGGAGTDIGQLRTGASWRIRSASPRLPALRTPAARERIPCSNF